MQSHFSLDISARYFEIAPRSRLSRHERVWCGEIALRSRRGVDKLSRRDISQSRRDGGYLAEISPILARSRRDCRDLTAGYFSRRDILKSRRDRGYLAEISPISARLPRSRRDLGQIFTRVTAFFFILKKNNSDCHTFSALKFHIHLYCWFALLCKYKFALKGDGQISMQYLRKRYAYSCCRHLCQLNYIWENCFVYELVVLTI